MCWGDKGITSITSSWLSRDLCAVPRPDGERGLDFVYQVTHVLLTSNCWIHWGGKKIKSLRASWWSRDLATI